MKRKFNDARELIVDPMEDKVGRYEYVEGSSDKFWQITPTGDGNYLAEWGRNGSDPQAQKVYSAYDALKKVHEKIAKGYQKVGVLEEVLEHPVKKMGADQIFKIRKKKLSQKEQQQLEEEDSESFLVLLRKI